MNERNKCRRAGFLILYCDPFGDSAEPRFLIATRWSGSYGFVGGVLNEGELLEFGIIRECQEEIGYDLSDKISEFEIVNSVYYEQKNMEFTTIKLKLSEKEIKKIWSSWRENGDMAEHEISGLSLMRMDEKIMSTFIENKFAGTAGEDLKMFIEQIKNTK